MGGAREESVARPWTGPDAAEALKPHARWRIDRRDRARPLTRLERIQVALTDSAPGRMMQRLFLRLPPSSRVRRLGIRLAIPLSTKAILARDRRGVACFYEADAEIVVPHWPGLAERYTGADGFLEFYVRWTEIWGEVELEQVEVIDLGSSLLLLGRMHTTGGTSGVSTTQAYACLQHYSAGKVARGEWFLSWEEGLAAIGLEDEPPPS
jgi:ketosteroid isomerase-like protein